MMSDGISCKTSTSTLARIENKRGKNNNNNIKQEPHFRRIFEPFSLSHFLSLTLFFTLYFSSLATSCACFFLATLAYISFSHSTEHSKIAFSLRLEVKCVRAPFSQRCSNRIKYKCLSCAQFSTDRNCYESFEALIRSADQPSRRLLIILDITIRSRFIVAKSHRRQQYI